MNCAALRRAYIPGPMRVYLRRPDFSDAEECIAAAKDSVALHQPWVFPPQSIAGWTEYVRRSGSQRHVGFLVCRREDNRVAGIVNFNEIIRGAMDGAFVGYWAFRSGAGQGYMTEGLALAFDQAFGHLGLHRLEANIQPANQRSTALARRLGLVLEGFSPKYLRIDGEWKDHERWAMLAESWRQIGGARGALERLANA